MTDPIVFLKEVRDELQKVVWPTRAEIIRLTVVVVIISLFVGIFIGGVDLILTKLLTVVFNI